MPLSELLPLHLRPALLMGATAEGVSPPERQFSKLVRIMLMYAGATDQGRSSCRLAPQTGSEVLRLMALAARAGPQGLVGSASNNVLRAAHGWLTLRSKQVRINAANGAVDFAETLQAACDAAPAEVRKTQAFEQLERIAAAEQQHRDSAEEAASPTSEGRAISEHHWRLLSVVFSDIDNFAAGCSLASESSAELLALLEAACSLAYDRSLEWNLSDLHVQLHDSCAATWESFGWKTPARAFANGFFGRLLLTIALLQKIASAPRGAEEKQIQFMRLAQCWWKTANGDVGVIPEYSRAYESSRSVGDWHQYPSSQIALLDPAEANTLSAAIVRWKAGAGNSPRLDVDLALASKLAALLFPTRVAGGYPYGSEIKLARGRTPRDGYDWLAARLEALLSDLVNVAAAAVSRDTLPTVNWHVEVEMFGPEFAACLDFGDIRWAPDLALCRRMLLRPLVTVASSVLAQPRPAINLLLTALHRHSLNDGAFNNDIFAPMLAHHQQHAQDNTAGDRA